MWLGLTIARSSPASTQWCRKTELRTARAGWPTPNETLETPSEVFTPGMPSLIARIPSIVATADGLHSSSPVVSVNVSASKISNSRVEPVLVAGDLLDPLRDLELALGRLRHPDLVDRQRDQRGAVRLRQRDHAVGLVAAGLEVDRVDDRAARDRLQRGLDHLGLGRVDLDRRRLGQRDPLDHLAHLLVLVLALGQRHADVEHVGAAVDLVLGDLDEAVVVVGEQQLLRLARALRVDPLADQGRARLLDQVGGGHHRADQRRRRRRGARPGSGRRPARRSRGCARAWCRSSRRRCRRRGARRTRRAPSRSARGSRGRSSRRPGPGAAARRSGCSEPAAASARRGSGSRRACPRGRSSSSGRSRRRRARASVVSTAAMSVPSSILPPCGSSETEVWIGSVRPASSNASRTPNTAAFTSRMSCAVSMMIRSAPPSTRPRACSANTSTRSRKLMSRRGSGRRTRAGTRSARSSRRRSATRPTALRAISAALRVDLERVLAQAPLVELQPRALEGVGLDHLGAGLEHRGVDALDHVGAVEHERLVALALEAAVVLLTSARTAPGSRPCRRRRRPRARGWLRKSLYPWWAVTSPPSIPAVAPCLAPGRSVVAAASEVRVPRPLWMACGEDTGSAPGYRSSTSWMRSGERILLAGLVSVALELGVGKDLVPLVLPEVSPCELADVCGQRVHGRVVAVQVP